MNSDASQMNLDTSSPLLGGIERAEDERISMSASAIADHSEFEDASFQRSTSDGSRYDASSIERNEGLDNSDFEAALRDSKYFTRTTVGNRVLTYILKVIQHPERARACGVGAKSTVDRRQVDPPPIVRLLIFERRNNLQIDITFSYEATFFLFATLEAAPAWAYLRYPTSQVKIQPVPTLIGTPVSGGIYLDRPQPAIFFIFPELSVRHEGKYSLCFNLYEMMSQLEGRDCTADELNLKKSGIEIYPEEATNTCNEAIWRVEIKSNMFAVFSSKKFPGLAGNTTLSRITAEQGVRVKLRRDLRTRRDIKKESDFRVSSRKDSMSSTGSFRDHHSSQAFDNDFLSASSVSSDNLNLRHMREMETSRLRREELANSTNSKPPYHSTLSEPSTTSPSLHRPDRLLGAEEPKSQKHKYVKETNLISSAFH